MPMSSRVAHGASFSDVSPDASPDASLHSSIPTFPRNLAGWRCFVAATGSPCWAPSSAACVVRGGHCPPVASPLLRLVVEPAGASVLRVGGVRSGAGADHDVARRLRYHGAQQPPAPQSPSAASPSLLIATSGTALTP